MAAALEQVLGREATTALGRLHGEQPATQLVKMPGLSRRRQRIGGANRLRSQKRANPILNRDGSRRYFAAQQIPATSSNSRQYGH